MIITLSDLGGTLLDAETYSCKLAADALKEIAALRIPLIIMSSKTRGETVLNLIRTDRSG